MKPHFLPNLSCEGQDLFLVDEGREDRNTSISGPSSTRLMANDGPTLNAGLVGFFLFFQGIRASIAKKSHFIFS